MSWDVILFSANGLPEGPIGIWPKDFAPPSLGMASTVREAISTAWPGTDWTDPAWGWFESEDLATEIKFQRDGDVESLMLHVRGGSDPVPRIQKLCLALTAAAVDTSTGDLLAADSGSSGYFGWLEFRNRVTQQPPD